MELEVDCLPHDEILNVEEVAQYLRKSTSWVYKNWKVLGGRKLGGSLFFPNKEDLYECLFGKREGLEIRLHPERSQVFRSMVQNENKSNKSRGRKKKGGRESVASHEDPNRYGLLDIG